VSLTGLPLLVLLMVLTVAAFAAVVRFWPRLAGRGPRASLGRLGALAVTQVLLLATVLAAANNYFGFYGSWRDLFNVATGHYAASTPTALGAAQNGSGITVNGHGTLPIPGGSDPRQGGRLDDVTVRGQLTGLSAHALIYLPPQYFQPAYSRTLFPAAIVSSGYPGDVGKLVTLLHYPSRMVDGISAGQDKPMVLIMMSPMIIPGRDTECTDVPGGGPRAGEFWALDVTSAVQRTYRVSAETGDAELRPVLRRGEPVRVFGRVAGLDDRRPVRRRPGLPAAQRPAVAHRPPAAAADRRSVDDEPHRRDELRSHDAVRPRGQGADACLDPGPCVGRPQLQHLERRGARRAAVAQQSSGPGYGLIASTVRRRIARRLYDQVSWPIEGGDPTTSCAAPIHWRTAWWRS
jgi:hypothetical protein